MSAEPIALSAPKRGAAADSNDDAYRVEPHAQARGLRRLLPRHRGAAQRVAVADGATQSFLAGRWARRLVDAAIETPMDRLEAHLETVRTGWASELNVYRDERVAAGRPLAWYEEQKAGGGAAATLLVADVRSGSVELASRGDTVAMHLRDGELLDAVPMSDPDAFGNHPELVVTIAEVPHLRRTSWSTRPSDQLVVATDALAEWLLRQAPGGGIATALDGLSRPDRFGPIIESEREHGRLHDDDVTLVVVEL